MYTLINAVAILIIFVTAYIFWIRPLLKQTPCVKELYNENGFLTAFRIKLVGIKQRLLAAFLTIASSSVLLYDSIIPAVTGVDITPLTAKVPTWAWPLIAIGFTALMNYFRTLADRRSAARIDAVAGLVQDDAAVVEVVKQVDACTASNCSQG